MSDYLHAMQTIREKDERIAQLGIAVQQMEGAYNLAAGERDTLRERDKRSRELLSLSAVVLKLTARDWVLSHPDGSSVTLSGVDELLAEIQQHLEGK